MTVPNYGSVYKLNTRSITGNTLKLKGNYASVIANISCNISISVNLSCSAIDTFAWYLYYNNEYPILVDVNGDRKPNKLGKDRFVMYFSNSRHKVGDTKYMADLKSSLLTIELKKSASSNARWM